MSPQLSHPKAERGKTAVLQVGHIYPRKCDRYAMPQTLGHNIIIISQRWDRYVPGNFKVQKL